MQAKQLSLDPIREKHDNYDTFEYAVANTFKGSNPEALFKTENSDELFDIYLNNLPAYGRQYYNCNCCRSFINKVGGLVTIDEQGNTKSAMWNMSSALLADIPFFAKSIEAMRAHVERQKVTGVFLTDESLAGTPSTNGWTHLHCELPSCTINRSGVNTAGQAMAEKAQDHIVLMRSLNEFTLDTATKAMELIYSETLYRADRVKPVGEFFHRIKMKTDNATQAHKKNICWTAVAKASGTFTHVRSSVIGTLLSDIQEGLSFERVAQNFKEKMNPANYMRSQSAPTENAKAQAEKLVMELGLADSLRRRYARIEEIPEFVWKPKKNIISTQPAPSLFGHIPTKDKVDPTDNGLMPSSTMTWVKFARTVLPMATEMAVKVDNPSRFIGLVTEAVDGAENIMQWNNPFSWYYHGGIDAEMKARVEQAGGQYENVDMRCSLMWNTYTDLDLHCICPDGHIHYGDKKPKRGTGGVLDVDKNVSPETLTPVENIRWTNRSTIRNGRYKFYVNNFTNREKSNEFVVELEIHGEIYRFYGNSTSGNVTAFEFDYYDGRVTFLTNAGTATTNWTAPTNSFVDVTGITMSPNMWGGEPKEKFGQHMFFLLDGVKDNSEGKGRGFFTETLTSELQPIRKTLEAFTGATPIERADEATACGVGYSTESDWNLVVKVKTGSATRLIKIDRWE